MINKLGSEWTRLLVVAAHPDDETLGCGATIARVSGDGGNVRVIFLADGVSSRFINLSEVDYETELARREDAADQALDALGCHDRFFWRYPDNRLDSTTGLDLIQRIEAEIASFKPTSVLTHFRGDLNVDHRVAANVTLTAVRPAAKEDSPIMVLGFEVPSSTEYGEISGLMPFVPNYFVDASGTWDRKTRALNCYAHELRLAPHPRSIVSLEALSRVRGSAVGMEHAEAFSVYYYRHF